MHGHPHAEAALSKPRIAWQFEGLELKEILTNHNQLPAEKKEAAAKGLFLHSHGLVWKHTKVFLKLNATILKMNNVFQCIQCVFSPKHANI